MPPNFPDEIWARLKTWAKAQAVSPAEPSIQACESYVRHICAQIAGDHDLLRPDVVAFYGRETLDMIAKFRMTAEAEGGVA